MKMCILLFWEYVGFACMFLFVAIPRGLPGYQLMPKFEPTLVPSHLIWVAELNIHLNLNVFFIFF
jgi:hypothetical protein